jgi:winged helix DNA-binding protein
MSKRGALSPANRRLTWEELAAATLPRQFPSLGERGEDAVVELVRRVGPIQSQAARAPFLSVAARLPGASYDAITATHESMRLVRSTSLRGTVHTSTREQHAALSAVATRSLAPLWRRTLKLDQGQLDAFRAEVEGLSESAWVTHDDIQGHLHAWFARHGLDESLRATEAGAGHFAFRTHAAMLRRPKSRAAGWDSQAEVVYRSARFAVDEPALDPQAALGSLVRSQLAASGPVTRRDLAWWSGEGLRNVDAAIASLGDELVRSPGPNGLEYLDLAEPPSAAAVEPGPRLLPEYDALLLGYDPKARERFADEDAVLHSWNRANGVHAPTLLLAGRLRGRWKLSRRGGTATIEVEMFPKERPPDAGDLAAPAQAVGAALGLTVVDVQVATISS